MKERERIRAVYAGRTPDRVPLMLDLSHWYKRNRNVPFNLSGFDGVEQGLVDLHKQIGAGAYCEMGAFYRLASEDPDWRLESETRDGVFITRIVSPLGTLHEERVFNPVSYSYGIRKHLLETPDDFPIIEGLMARLRCQPCWERYHAWQAALGDLAYPYAQLPYSGSGYIMARYMNVDDAVYALHDQPEATGRLIRAVNACNLRILDALIDGPFDTLIISDNYDSNIQTKPFFDAYVRDYYQTVARRLHAHGKHLAVHVDGESRGVLGWLAACGVDCADALTPAPMFARTPRQMRDEAGPDLILSGGIPATIFGPTGSDAAFDEAVKRWLDTRLTSPRLIMAAGDQVPPDADFARIARLPELVERHGRYT